MGWPVIPGTVYNGEPCAFAFEPGNTPYLILMCFNGIQLGALGAEEDLIACNGQYVATQHEVNHCSWIWEYPEDPAGPSDVYGCEIIADMYAGFCYLHAQADFWEIGLHDRDGNIVFMQNGELPVKYSCENFSQDPDSLFYGGACAVFAFSLATGPFSILSIANKVGFDGASHVRAEPYAIEEGLAGVRFARKCDGTRIYVRQEE